MRTISAACLSLLLPAMGFAQSTAALYVGRTVTAVTVVVEGKPSSDPVLADLIESRVGQPLVMREVRDSIEHLFSLGRFQDVRVEADNTEGGVSVHYLLIPLHGVERVEFTGDLGLSSRLLRRAMTERFGKTPPVSRIGDVVRLLTQLYEDRGYRRATITPGTAELHDPDRTVITFDIAPGPRARIGRVEVIGGPLEPEPAFLKRIGATTGTFYQHAEIQAKLTQYAQRLKSRGRYEATATLRPPALSDDGTVADLTIDVRPGPIVTIAFEGDPIPRDRWDDLVPVEQEGSADEDLLEDSARRIEDYLKQQGYWRARATFERQPEGEQMRIVFIVRRGLQYRVAGGVEFSGNRSIRTDALQPFVEQLRPNDLFVESELTAARSGIEAMYRARGYADAKVAVSETELDPVRPGEGQVKPIVTITEGPLVLIGDIRFNGNIVPESELRAVIDSQPGIPYLQEAAGADEDAVMLHYFNLGYAASNVQLVPQRNEDGTRMNLEFRIVEGPRTLVDHVIIVGNQHTDPEIIRRELRLRPGEPLGLQDRMESQRRLGALGLFRRVSVQPLGHRDGERMDVLVTVEEAPATSIGYGGGLEISRLLRPTGPSGSAEERFEVAPRGFFDVGRRNLWGKNRSVNLFTRLGLRPDDSLAEPGGSRFGFADYRIIATYRQPRLLGANDATVTGALEQGVRSSFNFARKGVISDLTRVLAPGIRASLRYSFSWTKTFDKGVGEEEQSFIDRLFPRVRLSQFSGALSRDTRDDVVYPSRGTFLSAEGSVAARSLGGQVGFMKTYLQAFWFRQVPRMNGTVFATRASLGLADGFQRLVQVTDPTTGDPIPDQFDAIEDLPASERFFAGGDTTIRGYALDTVGAPNTIPTSGFPNGGNAVLIMNAELRLPAWRDLAPVLFADGGNVFSRVTEFDIGELRGAVGLGLRYISPVGPIRVDVGFKLDRRVHGGQLERRHAVHLSIGHAF